MGIKLGPRALGGTVILALLMGCGGSSGGGGKTTKVTGVVLDQGRLVGQALVYLEGYRGTSSFSDFTDGNGRFTLSNIPPGNFVFIAEATLGARVLKGETPLLRIEGGSEQIIGPIDLWPVEGNRFPGTISGYVQDTDGNIVIGATVMVEGESPPITAITGIQGGFVLRGVTPERTHSLTAVVTDQENRRWRGRRDGVWVASGETTTNANLVLAPEGQMGTILGRVTDLQGRPLQEARVTAELIDTTIHLVATTNQVGDYVLADVPILPNGIWLTAAAADFENESLAVNNLVPGRSERRDFRLAGTVSTVPGAPRGMEIIALTYPRDPERSGSPARLYEPIRRAYYQRLAGARSRRWMEALPELTAQVDRLSSTRRPPTGIMIETDVFWDPVVDSDIAGYRLYRSLLPLRDFVPVADLPGADVWIAADISDDLSVETRYYYSVTSYSLRRNAESLLSSSVTAVPLPPLELKSPPSGPFGTSEHPLLEWEAVRGATRYTVIIFHDFPYSARLATQVPWRDGDLERVVPAPTTFVPYDGDQLVPGEDYYWVVIADKCPTGQPHCDLSDVIAQSFSPIWNFTVR